MNKHSQSQCLSRRNFIKSAALASLSTAGLMTNGSAAATLKSTVVLVRHKGAVQNDGKINQKVINYMLDRGITELSSKTTLIDAWQSYIPANNRVSVKINTIGTKGITGTSFTSHFSGVANAIVDRLKESGTEEKNIIIWDRMDSELVDAGLKLRKKEGQVRVMGTQGEKNGSFPGYDSKDMTLGKKNIHLSRILTDQTDILINVSLLKDHIMAGITGSLKNHYGSFDNPMHFHWHNCTGPGIPELNTLTPIKKKQKLCICDALMGVYDGGPTWKSRGIFTYNGLLLSTDPVAIDAVCLKLLNDQRKKQGKKTIKKSKARHIALSGDLGLGISRLESIDLKEIILS